MELITAGLPASMSLPTAGYGTGNPYINLENYFADIHMITQIPNRMNGARPLKIHHCGTAPGLHRPTSTTGGQPLIALSTRG